MRKAATEPEVAAFYHEDAINHQVTQDPVEGRGAIQAMFTREFAADDMVCIVENIFEDGDVAILEWRDPLGLRGCGFFHVKDGKIVFQRGYWRVSRRNDVFYVNWFQSLRRQLLVVISNFRCQFCHHFQILKPVFFRNYLTKECSCQHTRDLVKKHHYVVKPSK